MNKTAPGYESGRRRWFSAGCGSVIDLDQAELHVEFQVEAVVERHLVAALVAVDRDDLAACEVLGDIVADLLRNDGCGNLAVLAVDLLPRSVLGELDLRAVDEDHLVKGVEPRRSRSFRYTARG